MPQGNGSSGHPPGIGPMQLAQQKARPILTRRFYKSAAAADATDGRHEVRVDGRPVRTSGGAVLAVPSQTVAEVLAREWDAQGEFVNPATMPLTRLVNAAIDGVAQHMEEVRADIVRYAGSDLLCYRAEGPAELRRWQDETWSPVLDWLHQHLGAQLAVTTGIAHVAQPPEAIAAIARAVAPLDAMHLAALHSVTTLTGSPALALAVLHGRLTPTQAWEAAHLDEDWQARLWGADHEASQRRERRWLDMQAASFLLAS
jgi:chaperone required for assembly of F1-ATPase